MLHYASAGGAPPLVYYRVRLFHLRFNALKFKFNNDDILNRLSSYKNLESMAEYKIVNYDGHAFKPGAVADDATVMANFRAR